MNIFALSSCPEESARWAVDKHVIKMCLETAQLLCTVSWRYGVAAPYKATHAKHPCALWAGETGDNWSWLVRHGLALGAEYERRYSRVHGSVRVLEWARDSGGQPPAGPLTPFAQAMPETYRRPDATEAYRAFYRGEKAAFASWKAPAAPPPWWDDVMTVNAA